MSRGTGVISRFMPERHFGFLVADGGDELFFHELDCTELRKPLERGQRVTFERGEFRGRPVAKKLENERVELNITRVSDLPSKPSKLTPDSPEWTR
jgi:cold shock CspA family protein